MKRHPLAAFLIIASLFAAALVVAAPMLGDKGPWLAQPYMLTPAIAAIITRAFFYDGGFRDARLRFGRWRDFPKFWAASVGIMALAYLSYTLLGAIRWDFSGGTFLRQLEERMGPDAMNDLPAGWSPRHMLLLFLVGGLTVFNLPGILMGFGEEFGWRGFLWPRLRRPSPWRGLVIGGTIWFAWHLPLVLVMPASMRPPLTPATVAASVALALPASILAFTYFAWVYARTGSIWVVSLAHITQNNASMAFSLFAPLDMKSAHDSLLANLGLLVTMGLVVAWLHRTGRLAILAGTVDGPPERLEVQAASAS